MATVLLCKVISGEISPLTFVKWLQNIILEVCIMLYDNLTCNLY